MKEILRIFPKSIATLIEEKTDLKTDQLQEIRLRLNQPIEIIYNNEVSYLSHNIHKNELTYILNQLSEYSLYRLADELREGYITLQGGHRVGIAGQVITENGSVKAIKNISFLNIRIAKEKLKVAEALIPYLYTKNYLNTLLVGPPQSGKTTYLRDLVRIISSGWRKIPAKKVALIDERSEIAASKDGLPQHDIGRRTDVMDACPKVEGMMMMIRSMSPDIVVVDEIGHKKDVEALLEAINAGVTVICTIHGNSIKTLKKRPSLQKIFSENIFERIVLLKRHTNPGYIHKIYNEQEQNIFPQKRRNLNEVDWSNHTYPHINYHRL